MQLTWAAMHKSKRQLRLSSFSSLPPTTLNEVNKEISFASVKQQANVKFCIILSRKNDENETENTDSEFLLDNFAF